MKNRCLQAVFIFALAFAVLMALGVPLALAASSMAYTISTEGERSECMIITITWVAASNGTVTGVQSAFEVHGYVWQIVWDPGTPAPTNLYDTTITDEDNCDILGGEGLNRYTIESQQAYPKAGSGGYGPRRVDSKITLWVANNSEDGATGEVKLYVIR